MITVVTRWETSQLPPIQEWQLWRQMRGAFGIDRFVFVPVVEELNQVNIDQYPTMEEALESTEGERVFLEPGGYRPVTEIPQGDIVLILGNTQRDNMHHARVSETYRIHTNGAVQHNHLYAPNAAAIALAMRLGQ